LVELTLAAFHTSLKNAVVEHPAVHQELQAVGFRIDNMMRDARLTALTQAPMEVEPLKQSG
jgi:hypothetical protein